MQRGYTLIEVMLVVLLLTFAATVAMPSIVGVKAAIYDIQLEGAAAQLAADIRCLQQMSMNAGNSHYYILTVSIHDGYFLCDRLTVIKKVGLQDVLIQCISKDIIFSTNGTPNQGYTIALTHQKTGKSKVLTILPVTGRVMVK